MTKTRKTLLKRVKITKTGKILKKQLRTGHLKRKMDVSRKARKSGTNEVTSKGYRSKIKKLLSKAGGKI